ncbi:MAG: AAA family ATPase [Caldilineaceae bacterium]
MSQPLTAYSAQHLVVITGARQTGKTTLARGLYADLNYINLDAIEQREAVRAVRTDMWAEAVGPAILDEAQKEPGVFDKVKYAFDAGQIQSTVLLGSSQILMLQKVRETLAGRAFIYELWPLMACELVCPADAEPQRPLLDRLLNEPGNADELLATAPIFW